MNKIFLPLSIETKSNHNPQFHNKTPINNPIGFNHRPTMNIFKEALIQFANTNPNLFPNDATNSYPKLIEQRFSQFFPDFQTPNHPPYAAMIHRAIKELNEKDGSSEDSISNYIKQEYVDLPWAHSTLLKHHLEKLCDRNEIFITDKQCYKLAVADSAQISTSTSEKLLKRKKILETEKKISGSCKKRKKRKSKNDSESGKTVSGSRKNRKKSKKPKSKQDLELGKTKRKQRKKYKKREKCKQIIEVCQEQEFEQENNLIDACINQEIEEGGVCENVIEQNQPEEILLIKHFDVTENENQSVEQNNDMEQIGTKKRKRKQKLKSKSSKRIKKNETNEIQVLSEEYLKQENEVIDNELNEQKQIIEVNTSDIQIQEENKDGEIGIELHPDFNSILHKNGKRVWTRSQLKTIAIKDEKIPKDKFDIVEYSSEEKQLSKQTPNTVSTQINGQRAKLRSSQKNTCQLASVDMQLEPIQNSNSPNLDNALIEVFDPICTNSGTEFTDFDEPIEMQELEESKDEVSGKVKTTNKKDKLKRKVNGEHKMTRRSSRIKSNN